MLRRFLPVMIVTLVAACSGQDDDTAPTAQRDPAVEQALTDELMTDPDLAGRNEANAALSGVTNDAIPQIDKRPEAIEAARTRAAEMVGGQENMVYPPAAIQLGENGKDTAAMTAAARATVRPGGTNCASSVGYTASWAAKLPAAFPVYPRANTLEAAGSDEGACSLRIVSFLTPVPTGDVLAFYYTRARGAGYTVEHVTRGGDDILSATRGSTAMVVYARRRPEGVSEIDLVTSE